MERVRAREDGVEPPAPDVLALVEEAAQRSGTVDEILSALQAGLRETLEGLKVDGKQLTTRQAERLAWLRLGDGTASEMEGGWHLGTMKSLARLGLVDVREFAEVRSWTPGFAKGPAPSLVWEATLTDAGKSLDVEPDTVTEL